ncbi:hypothetical protein EIN_221920 [Entamoeba invadens IP1]|uniref:sphingomyelin phosphodiesterase n=1 Tax=Entamoeba invadens IP1 TaxID=370355 RepID=A0A0A1U222_ENTIV|nr:hypothetical protein EIN_221920 [Entamoeba invadens IP1]ELP88059.1 hypothetical protein EIN_221920 [Entamoeba invadens IP1]|eukprot:XP_004254830.1 hypothetical protein EIN_221920 [Entamoeba invadens IP1]
MVKVTEVNWNKVFSNEFIISVSVIGGIGVGIFLAIFIFQCYHRNCFQKIREIFIHGDYSSEKIRVLSYNLCLRAPLITNNGDDFKATRLELFIKNVIDNYDIILLQDVIGAYNARRTHLIECSAEVGLCYSHVSLTPILPCFLCDGGLMILSRMPLLNRDQYVFKKSVFPDSLFSRGILYAKVHPNNTTTIHLFNTHLQPISKDEKAKEVRRHQLDEVVKFIQKKTAKDNFPILVCGDFSVNALESTPGVVENVIVQSSEASDDEKETLGKDIIKYVEEQTDEYIQVINSLSLIGTVKDVMYSGLQRHPVTLGDTYFEGNTEMPLETVLTKPDDQYSKRCQDFIFTITRSKELEIVEPYVHTYDVADEEIQFLSSHYALSCSVKC